MIQITIETDDAYANMLFELLTALKFIKSVNISPKIDLQHTVPNDDFFALAGLWEGRDIDLQTIRNKAWPIRSI